MINLYPDLQLPQVQQQGHVLAGVVLVLEQMQRDVSAGVSEGVTFEWCESNF